ncbi:hypothetical protein XENOCAPTIV_002787, partial [Xenoophorus captivus]
LKRRTCDAACGMGKRLRERRSAADRLLEGESPDLNPRMAIAAPSPLAVTGSSVYMAMHFCLQPILSAAAIYLRVFHIPRCSVESIPHSDSPHSQL